MIWKGHASTIWRAPWPPAARGGEIDCTCNGEKICARQDGVCCQPEQLCNEERVCCPSGETCGPGDACCPTERVCRPSNTCCPAGGVPNACCAANGTFFNGVCVTP